MPTLSFAPGFPAADFAHCGPSVFAYGKTQADADAAADASQRSSISHEDDFDGRIYSPDEGVRYAMELAKTRDQADRHRRHPGQSRRRRRFRHHGHAARAGAQQRHKAAIGVIYDPASAKAAHAAGVGATVTLALGGKSGIPGDAPYQGELSSSRNCRTENSSRPGRIMADATWTWGRRPLADRRCQGGRRFAQGAARRPVDVPLCRHRADRAIDPGQQELGAFPRRFRADRRKAPDLRRARRDAGRYRGLALDAAASGYPHQAERRAFIARKSRPPSPANG